MPLLLGAGYDFASVGGPVLVLVNGSGGGASSTVFVLDRQSFAAAAAALVEVAGAQGRRLRCTEPGASPGLGGWVLCGATELGGTLSVFVYDPANPFAVPAGCACSRDKRCRSRTRVSTTSSAPATAAAITTRSGSTEAQGPPARRGDTELGKHRVGRDIGRNFVIDADGWARCALALAGHCADCPRGGARTTCARGAA